MSVEQRTSSIKTIQTVVRTKAMNSFITIKMVAMMELAGIPATERTGSNINYISCKHICAKALHGRES